MKDFLNRLVEAVIVLAMAFMIMTAGGCKTIDSVAEDTADFFKLVSDSISTPG